MRADIIGHCKPCMTDIYIHIDARMADYIRTHPYIIRTGRGDLHRDPVRPSRRRPHLHPASALQLDSAGNTAAAGGLADCGLHGARIENVVKYQSCMVSKLPIISLADCGLHCVPTLPTPYIVRRFQIVRHARTQSVGKYQSCMF